MINDSSDLPLPARPPSWAQRILQLREEEWLAHRDCLAAARECLKRYSTGPHRSVTLRDIARLLELASKLGRLATGIGDSVGAMSSYEDPELIAELQKQLHEAFTEPVPVDENHQLVADEDLSDRGEGRERSSAAAESRRPSVGQRASQTRL